MASKKKVFVGYISETGEWDKILTWRRHYDNMVLNFNRDVWIDNENEKVSKIRIVIEEIK